MRVIFMGTPNLSATILQELNKYHEIIGVFTRPDAVRGRGKNLVASSVKQTAHELKLNIYTPKTLNNSDTQDLINSLCPDIICVAAYGCILPKAILDLPRYGCLNVHTSLLPRWRGAAPIERAILAGDDSTGVCIMRMEESLDTGPYCIRYPIPIDSLYLSDLTLQLAKLGAEALVDAITQIEHGTVKWTNQSTEGVTYAYKLKKDELNCCPQDSLAQIGAKVRISSASRAAKIKIAGRTIALERVAAVNRCDISEELPGAGLATLVAKRLVIGVSDGALELIQVKPDGKKSMKGCAFASGIQGIKGVEIKWEKA